MPSTTAAVSSAVIAGALGYCLYFDYKRRSSPEFRKTLKKRSTNFQKKVEKEIKEVQTQKRAAIDTLIEQSLQDDPIPTSLGEKEKFFMQEIEKADKLLTTTSIPDNYLLAALSFYRALVAYPKPVDLLSVYEKSITVPEVMDYLRTMIVASPPPALAAAVQGAAGLSAPDLGVE